MRIKLGLLWSVVGLCLAGCARGVPPDDRTVESESALRGLPCQAGRLELGCVVEPEWGEVGIDETEMGPARKASFPAESDRVRKVKEIATSLGKVVLYSIVHDDMGDPPAPVAFLRAYVETADEILRLEYVGRTDDLETVSVRTMKFGESPGLVIESPTSITAGGVGQVTYYAIPQDGRIFCNSENLGRVEADLDGDGIIELMGFGVFGGRLFVTRFVPGKGFITAEVGRNFEEITQDRASGAVVDHPELGMVLSYEEQDDHWVRSAHLFRMAGDKFELVQKPQTRQR